MSSSECPGSAEVWERSSLPSSTKPYSTTYSSLKSNTSAADWLYSSFLSLAVDLTPGSISNDVSDSIMGFIEFKNLGILNTHLITIGRGSHFTVLALNDELEESSLVKVVFKRTVPQARPQSDQTFRTRIEAMMLELRALAHEPIRKHQNIVNIQGITWETDPFTTERHWPVFIIERATRGTLQDFFREEADICLTLRFELALDVIAGLEVIHACGIIHGDLKLENVLVFENKGLDADKRPLVAKLADFGGSLFDISTFTRLKTPTQPWSAPEFEKYLEPQALQLTDIYSLGLLLWRILTGGKHPFAKPILPHPNESTWLRKVSTLKNDNEKMHARLLDPEIFGTKKELGLASKVVLSLVQLDASKRDLGLAKAAIEDAALGLRPMPDFGGLMPHQVQLRNQLLPYSSWGNDRIDPSMFSSIARELTVAAQLADSVPAAAEAKYGLAVLHIDQSIPSNDERTNIELGLNWLQESALMGCDRARAIIYRVFRSFQRPLPQSCEENITTWLVDTAAKGFFQSLEDLGELGGDHLIQQALKLLKTKYSGTGVQRYDNVLSTSIDELLESDEKTVKKLRGIHGTDKKSWKSRRGDTLLHFSASCGLLQTLQHSLANNPAALNGLNGESETPLLLACRSGHYSVVFELLTSGANPRIRNERGESPFHWLTSFEGDQVREICQVLLQHSDSGQLDAVADEVGYIYCRENKYIKGTPLMRAVARNRLDVVLVLLDYGSSPGVTVDDSTALNLAAGLHYPEILSALLCHTTIDPHFLYPATGMSLIRAAIVGGCFERRSTFGRLRRHGPGWLVRARDTMQTLIDFGSSDILETISGLPNSTVLAFASAFSQVDIVEYLLRTEAKAQLNSWSIIPGEIREIETTPVGASILGKNLQIFRLLIEQGASVKKPYPYTQSSSLLYECADCSNDNPEFAQMLIDRGVEVNETPGDFEPPFACALRNRCFKLASCLFRNGADPGIEYSTGLFIQTRQPKSILGHLIHECSVTTLPCLSFLFGQAKPQDAVVDFIVSRSIKFTALHEIASIPPRNQDDAASKVILGCILDFFKPSVEQISAPCAIEDYTALHLAITMANFPVVQGILHYGIKPSLEANEGIWGLHLAEGLRDGLLDELLPDGLNPTNAMEMEKWKSRMKDIVQALEYAGFREIS